MRSLSHLCPQSSPPWSSRMTDWDTCRLICAMHVWYLREQPLLEQVREKTRLSEHQMETLCFSHNNSTHLRCFLWPPPETVEPFLSLSLKIRICFWLRAILILSTSKNVWRNSHRPTDVPSSKAPHLHSCPDRAKRSFCASINAVELQVLTGVGGVKWLKRWSL